MCGRGVGQFVRVVGRAIDGGGQAIEFGGHVGCTLSFNAWLPDFVPSLKDPVLSSYNTLCALPRS
jgi:hypothetical protein